MFEETNRNTLPALAAHYELHPPKGEIVLVIEGKNSRQNKKDVNEEEA